MVDGASKYQLLSGMTNINAQLNSEMSEGDQPQPTEKTHAKPKPVWKQPRPVVDGWPEENTKAREMTAKLFANL